METVIELVNGCVIGNPLPALLTPWCAPSGCAPASTTTTTTPPPPIIPPGAKLVLVPSSIVSSGGVVTGWNDISGNGNNLAAFGGPTLGNIGSQPAIAFNGTTAYLQSTDGAVPVNLTSGFTQFILMVSVTGLQDLLYNGEGGDAEFVTAIKAGAGAQSTFIVTDFGVSGVVVLTNASTPAGSAVILWGRTGAGTGAVSFGQTGDTTASGSYGSIVDIPATSGRITVGNSNPLGANSFSGVANCIIEYDRNLTDAEVSQVLTAMAAFAV